MSATAECRGLSIFPKEKQTKIFEFQEFYFNKKVYRNIKVMKI